MESHDPTASRPAAQAARTLGLRLLDTLTRNWWVLLLRGLAAIAFGVIAWIWPGLSIATLVLLFGLFAFADGALGLWTAITGPKGMEHRGILLLWALAGLATGALAVFAPALVAASVILLIGVWAMVTGAMEIVAAIQLRKEIQGEWLLILAGLASVGFGLVLVFRPGAGALALVWMIGLYAVLLGALMVLLSLKVRSVHKRVEGAAGA
ncbi:MAG TPA: HdeD family acid-resistance protein [Longimicrobiales bacterium]|nr:HdeD family acid-resistance protein [Longimicrobiales bacterium]